MTKPDLALATALAVAARAAILLAWHEGGGNHTWAAGHLGVSPRQLYRRIADLGMQAELDALGYARQPGPPRSATVEIAAEG